LSGSEEEIMIKRSMRLAWFVSGVAILAVPAAAGAQPYIYPNQGQTSQQQQFDKGQCYSWAVQQTGFDPTNPQVASGPPPAMPQQQPQGLFGGGLGGGLFRGAAGGAAMGAVGGAIGGDAGKGAAIGAAVGELFGMMRRARAMEEEQQQQQQQQQMYAAQQQGAMSQGRSNYERAFGACMAGRGYTVR